MKIGGNCDSLAAISYFWILSSFSPRGEKDLDFHARGKCDSGNEQFMIGYDWLTYVLRNAGDQSRPIFLKAFERCVTAILGL